MKGNYRDLAMLIVAIAVSGAVLVPAIGVVVLDRPLSPGGADVLNSAISTLVGVLAAYIGGRVTSGNGDK